MKKLSKLSKVAAVLAGGFSVSGVVLAGAVTISDDMPRRGPGSVSGSLDTVEANCTADPSGNDWQGATATLKIKQVGDSSTVDIIVENAVPNTVFDVWLRMTGSGPGDETGGNGGFGPSPMTGGGATPLLPGYTLDTALSQTPPFLGTPTPTNGFTTDYDGNARFRIDLDFPVVGGAYPFQRASTAAVQDLRDAGSSLPLVRIPSVIANPADPDISGPFLLRVVSHCTDLLSHGLSPAVREAWFQYP